MKLDNEDIHNTCVNTKSVVMEKALQIELLKKHITITNDKSLDS